LISYETLRVKSTSEILKKYNFDVIICDEAKALINNNSKQAEII